MNIIFYYNYASCFYGYYGYYGYHGYYGYYGNYGYKMVTMAIGYDGYYGYLCYDREAVVRWLLWLPVLRQGSRCEMVTMVTCVTTGKLL